MDVLRLAGRPGAYADVSMNSPEDLIARARSGDEESFRLIFERYTRPVIRFIFYMVNDAPLAEELAQETFVRAYKNLSALRDDEKLPTWLFGIARNVALEALRKRGRERNETNLADSPALELSDANPSPIAELLDKELGSKVRSALLALDHDKRLVFTLKVYHQRSYEEISVITGFSIPKIRNDLHRARTLMRRRLQAYLGVSNEL